VTGTGGNWGKLGAGLLLSALVALAAAALLGGSPSLAEGAANKRLCGIPPGDGAYSYIKTRNVSCRVAQKVRRKAGRKFCGKRFQRCSNQPGAGYKKGRVKAKGWRCKMRVGWEFFRADCKRGGKRFVAETAS
jgi:hypothetical protein